MEDRAGGIWVSSEYSGVARISVLNEGTSRIYPENPELFDRSNAIRTIGEMPNGDIGITTRKGGLFTYDTHFNQKMNKTYFQSNIYAVEKDADGKLWMGTRGEGLKIGNWILSPYPIIISSLFAATPKTVCGSEHLAADSIWPNLLPMVNISFSISFREGMECRWFVCFKKTGTE